MSNDKRRYTLVVKKQKIEVSKEVYKAYYESKEREKYIEALNRRYSVSLEDLQEKGVNVELAVFNEPPVSVEDEAISKILIAHINESLNLLSPDELFLFKEIFENEISERKLAKKLGVPQQTVNNRKKAILKKLFRIINTKNI